MKKTTYEDYKYCMQDTGRVYLGCKYTFGEIAAEEDILFKLRLIFQKYIISENDAEDSLETHLYYLSKESFLVSLYKQMKARIKVSVIEEKKHLFGKPSKQYVTKQLTIEELTAIPAQDKEKCGMVIQELSVSKLALLGL